MEILKRCTTCQTDKPSTQFRKQSKNKDGLKYTCIQCDDARAKTRYLAKKEEIIKKVLEYRAKKKSAPPQV